MKKERKNLPNSPHELFRASGKLKMIRRAGWHKKAGIEDCESVADHSFRTALLGAYFAAEQGLDSGKVARMCLLHDLAEAYTGDLMPEEKTSGREHRMKENTVMKSLLAKIPVKGRKRLDADWEELYSRQTKEAKLAWQVDKLEMGLQQREYISRGYDKRKLGEFDPAASLPRKMQHLLAEYEP